MRIRVLRQDPFRSAVALWTAVVGLGLPLPRAQAEECRYHRHPGTCTILSAERTEESAAQAAPGGAGYPGLDVRFAFAPAAPLSLPPGERSLHDAFVRDRPQRLLLANSWFPGPAYLAKYGIAPGAALPCDLALIVAGTCTPWRFELAGVDPADYFESAGAGGGR